MKNGNNTKRVKNKSNKLRLGLAVKKQWDSFFMQVAMEPYSQLGTGERCKAAPCCQPVYDHESGLCSLHRMEEAERAFEDRQRARQQQSVIQRKKAGQMLNRLDAKGTESGLN